MKRIGIALLVLVIGGGIAYAAGQTVSANASSVVIASDQSAVAVKGGGTAGAADTNVLTVQGIASMTPLLCSQNAGPWTIAGNAADGAALSGNPVEVAGSDGSHASLLRLQADNSAATTPNALLVQPGRYDSSYRTLTNGRYASPALDIGGRSIVSGAAATGAAVTGSPLYIGGIDSAGNAEGILTDVLGAIRVGPGNAAWSVTNTSAAAAQGTASQAAGATGIKHCATSVTAQLRGDATGNADQGVLNVRDGATGAGTVLWTSGATLASGANAEGTQITATFPSGLCGSTATAMTVEFSAAGATHTIQVVNLSGFDTK